VAASTGRITSPTGEAGTAHEPPPLDDEVERRPAVRGSPAAAAAVERRRIAARREEVELEGAEERRRGRTRVEEHDRVVHEPIDFTSRLAPEDHPVGELEEVAAGGEAIEVLREGAERPEELAAEQEDQLGRHADGRNTARR